jgi:hypothetical protein
MSRALPEMDAEQEVDFARYWRALAARWWLPLAGIVLGAIIGAFASLGGSSGWKATTQIYLGHALVGGSLIQLAPTAVSLTSSAVTSEAATRSVASKIGVPPSRLRGHVETRPVFGETGTKVGTPTPIMEITVTGLPRGKVALAANALGAIAVKEAASIQVSKLGLLRQHLAFDQAQLAAVNARLTAARETQSQILADKALSATDRLLGIVNQNAVITQALAQQIGLQDDAFQVQQSIQAVADIGTAKVVTPASAESSPGPSRRTAIAVGAFIGLIVGIFAAVLWEPLGLPVRPR